VFSFYSSWYTPIPVLKNVNAIVIDRARVISGLFMPIVFRIAAEAAKISARTSLPSGIIDKTAA
jgi:hypothetical protein